MAEAGVKDSPSHQGPPDTAPGSRQDGYAKNPRIPSAKSAGWEFWTKQKEEKSLFFFLVLVMPCLQVMEIGMW